MDFSKAVTSFVTSIWSQDTNDFSLATFTKNIVTPSLNARNVDVHLQNGRPIAESNPVESLAIFVQAFGHAVA